MPVEQVEIDESIFLPCYRHLIDSEFFDIDFLYGGRDSGKSRHIAMQLVVDCMREGYFKCLLIRKVLNTVRDSQYSLIKSIIEDWNIKHLFSFNDTRMEIICRINGNGFYGRGLDDVGRIKSFNNPSHCWIEEGNQIDNDDFVVILTSLRAEQRVKTWFSFNPECDVNYTEFWLWQEYFQHTTALSFTWIKTVDTDDGPVEFRIRATHSTYKDNPYCKPQRKALYESYKASKNNAYWYQTYTLGLWGYKRTGGEFWKCFEEVKHVKEVKLEASTIHLVADNNVNPYIAVSAWQVFPQRKLIRQVNEFPCESPDNTAKKAALKALKWLERIDYKDTVFIYGDPSANAKSTVDDEGKSFFDKFIATVTEDRRPVINRVQKSAPEVALSGSFVNEIYESNYAGWTIEIGSECRKSIEDYTMAKEDAEGKILKKRETDKDTKVSFERYGHFSDCKRYFITTILANEFNQYKSRSKRRGSRAA
jgi:PBSX family phage terminase large subunit